MVTDDDKSVRPAARVAEANGAKCVGLLIILVTFAPFGVMIMMDLWKFVKCTQQYNKPHRPRKNRPI